MIIRDLIHLAYGLLAKGWKGFHGSLTGIRRRNMKAITEEVELAIKSPLFREYLKKKDRNFHRMALGSMFACIGMWITLLVGVSYQNIPSHHTGMEATESGVFAEPIRPRPPLPKHQKSIQEKADERVVIWHELQSDVK